MKKMCILLLFAIQLIMSQDCTIKLVTGNEINEIIPVIALQWVEANCHYPYLYKGTLSDGIGYFQKFLSCQHAAVAVAYDQQHEIIGFVSATPIIDFANHFTGIHELFEQASLHPELFYYISDVIVVTVYRQQGIAKRLFKVIEANAKALGYMFTCLACESHEGCYPQKPDDYYELDNVWKKFGYHKTSIVYDSVWDTIQLDGTVEMKSHPLMVWAKELTA